MSFEYESLLKYKTKVGKYEEIKGSQPSPQDRQKVYFTCHQDDFDKYFDDITNEILSKQPNCAIYFYDGVVPTDEEDIDLDLNQMILFVIPVTYNFICDDNCQARKDFKFAEENNISMLLLQQDYGLEEEFNQKCGDYQMLSKFPSLQNSQFYDPTAITYDEKLTKYLESRILGDELVKEIQQAFDAYIFLSYRKKDRKYAQELMKLIHSNDFCRDIAIWYDEFLVPGEDFNDAIKKAMKKSKLFSMVVTPNLINEANYVQSTEYPAAKESGKPMFPAESVPTDHAKLKELYPDIPDTVDTNGAEFSKELLNAIHKMAIKENDKDPKHNYLIGLAYLNGIDVEKDTEKGISLITSAAEAGLFEAQDKLYKIGKELYSKNASIDAAELVEKVYDCCEDTRLKASVAEFISRVFREANYYKEAEELALEALEIRHKLAEENPDDLLYVSGSYHTLTQIYLKLKRIEEVEKYGKDALEISKKFVKENPGKYLGCVINDCNVLSLICRDMYNYDEAEKLLLEAMNLSLKLIEEKPEHIGYIASTSNNLANLYKIENKFDEAENLYKKAIDIIRKEMDKKADDIYIVNLWGITSMGLADLYRKTNRIKTAESIYLEILDVYRKLSEKNSLIYNTKVAATCHSLATLYTETDRLAESEKLLREARDIYSSLAYNEKNYPDLYLAELASCALSFASIDEKKKLYLRAESWYKDCLNKYLKLESKMPGAYLDMLTRVYNGLANTYQSLSRFEQAEKMYFMAIETREKLCAINPDVYLLEIADPYLNLAILYRDHGRESEAEDYYLKGIETLEYYGEKNLGYTHTKLYRAYESLAELYKKCKRYEDAEVSLRKSISIVESQPYINDSDIYSLSGIYEKLSKIKTDDLIAEEMMKKSLNILDKINDKNCKRYYVYITCSLINIAEYYQSKQMKDLAENYYADALENVKRLKAYTNEKVFISVKKEVCDKFADFYKKIGFFDKAEEILTDDEKCKTE